MNEHSKALAPLAAVTGHQPVLLQEVLMTLGDLNGKTVIDATFGGGGYARAFLGSGTEKVLGLDRDPDAIVRGEVLKMQVGEEKLALVHTPFSRINLAAAEAGMDGADAIVFDLGVSSYQLDEAARGFSYRNDGPLDMRMDPHETHSAADLVNGMDENELSRIFLMYGEERHARAIARKIVQQRAKKPFRTTRDLARLLEDMTPKKSWGEKHPATRVFQALRMAVNRELEEVETALERAARLLKPGGRLIVVSFHSLEDRLVKTFFAKLCGEQTGATPRGLGRNKQVSDFFQPFKKALKPAEQEKENNPRARSARLRVVERRSEQTDKNKGEKK